MDATDGNAPDQDYTLLPRVMLDASTLSAGASALYIYLCYLASKRGTSTLAGNIIEEYINRYAEEVRPNYSADLCFDALYELTFPRAELGGKSYVSIEMPFYLTDEEEDEDERYPGRTRRNIHLNDISEANARHCRWERELERAEGSS